MGAMGYESQQYHTRAREPALCLESLVADSLEKGALTWFP